MNQNVQVGVPASGIVSRLFAASELTVEEIVGLTRAAPDVAALATLDLEAVAGQNGVPSQKLRILRDAAQLLGLSQMTEERAVALGRSGISLDALARHDPMWLYHKLRERGIAGQWAITAEEVFAWSVQARRWARVQKGKPALSPLTELPAPKHLEPFSITYIVADAETSWEKISQRYYPNAEDKVGLGERLRLANGQLIAGAVGAGERIALPTYPNARPRIRDVRQVAAELQGFADYLDMEEAERLAQAGYRDPGALLYLSPSTIATLTGINPGKLEQLQAQVLLSSLPGMPPEIARYIASQEGWGSSKALALASVEDLIGAISKGVNTGYLNPNLTIGYSKAAGWLADLIDATENIDIILPLSPWVRFPPYLFFDSPCATLSGPGRYLENAYSYRFVPQAMSETVLADQLNKRLEFLGRARDTIQAGNAPTQVAKIINEVKQVCGLQEDSLATWGLPNLGGTPQTRMVNVKRYLRDNTLIVNLLQALTEGHNAFQHGEFGLALSAYGRAEALFSDPRLGSADEEIPDLSVYWSHNAAGVPKFADNTTPQWNANKLDRVAVYYEDRAAGNAPRERRTDPATSLPANNLLEGILHVSFADYHRQLLLGNLGAPGNQDTFRRYLYYIRNFVLPMCQGDVYLELGNHCRALELYFSVYYEPTFSLQLPAAKESILQSRIQTDAEKTNPGNVVALFSRTAIDTSAPRRYYGPYLHAVEKQVIRLRVAETMFRWGEYHYRRDERNLARARYAQTVRILFDAWHDFLPENFATAQQLENALQTTNHNPRVLVMAFEAYTQLLKIKAGRNFLNYPDNYVPVLTYPFLLNAARYLTEHARQLERDSLQALVSAEQEAGNLRLLNQALSTARSQLAVELRRVDEADAAKRVGDANKDLADLREQNAQDRIDEIQRLGSDLLALGTFQGVLSGAATGAGIAGPYGIAAGAILGGTTAYLSNQIELQMRENEFKRQQFETAQSIVVAQAEVDRANITADITRLQRNLAMMNVRFAQSNLEFAQAKTLNADFWYNTSRRLREFAHTYLNRAIEVAFLAEQAFEFQEERRIDRIKFDYVAAEDRLAAEALLADLDSIEFERIVSRRTKNMPLRYTVSLRERDFIAFSEFKRTGEITFDVPLWEFDMAHLGTYLQSIVRVEVVVRALATGSGIRGSLTKSGLSYLRFRPIPSKSALSPPNVAPDWIQYTPSPFKIAPQVLSPETLVLSSYEHRRDAVMLRPDPGEQMYAFEGSGLGTTWTLRLSPASNDFDLNTIADVSLILYVQTEFDEDLREIAELERRKLIALGQFVAQRSRGYSFREVFPDQLYSLQNPPTPSAQHLRRRLLTFRTRAGDFLPNQVNRQITGLVLAFPGTDTLLPIQPRLTSLTRSPTLAEPLTSPAGLNWFPSGAGPGWFHPPADPNVNSTNAFTQAPDDLWALWIDADANPALCRSGRFQVDANGNAALDMNNNPIPDATPAGRPIFDPAKIQAIKDVWFILGYRYELAGEGGDPVPFWAHFNASAQGQYVTPTTPPAVTTVTWQIDDLVGAGAWTVISGRLQQTAPGATSIYRPTTELNLVAYDLSWSDLAIDAQVVLPTTIGDAVGLVARYAPTGTADHPRGYYLTISAAAGGVFDLRLERQGTGGGVLAQQLGVSLVSGLSYPLRLRAVGTTLEAWVGERRVFKVTDGVIGAGDVGLYAVGTTSSFTDVWVSDLTNRA